MTAIPLTEMAAHRSARSRLVSFAPLQTALEETALQSVEIPWSLVHRSAMMGILPQLDVLPPALLRLATPAQVNLRSAPPSVETQLSSPLKIVMTVTLSAETAALLPALNKLDIFALPLTQQEATAPPFAGTLWFWAHRNVMMEIT